MGYNAFCEHDNSRNNYPNLTKLGEKISLRNISVKFVNQIDPPSSFKMAAISNF